MRHGPAGTPPRHDRADRRDLRALRAALRALPDPPLPDGLLDDVRDATRATVSPRRARGRVTFAAAAAAIVVLAGALAAALTTRSDDAGDGAPGEYSDARLTSIEADLRVAMTRVGRALASAERVTVSDALGSPTSAILRRGTLSAPAGGDGASP